LQNFSLSLRARSAPIAIKMRAADVMLDAEVAGINAVDAEAETADAMAADVVLSVTERAAVVKGVLLAEIRAAMAQWLRLVLLEPALLGK
jgi:hypothetical protein